MTVRFNVDDENYPTTVRGRVAAYVWGPDIGSRWTAHSSWQQAGGVGGLLMVLDGVSVDYLNNSSVDPIDDDYVDSLAPHARLALRVACGDLPSLPPVGLVPLMDRMGNVTGCKKAQTNVPAAQLDAVFDYDAFGQEIRSTGPAADVVPFHFSTKPTDPGTGLVYYGYRWYDAGKGRWISRDPIGERGGVNLSNFCVNRSTGVVDSDGRFPIVIVPIIVGTGLFATGCSPKPTAVTYPSDDKTVLIVFGHHDNCRDHMEGWEKKNPKSFNACPGAAIGCGNADGTDINKHPSMPPNHIPDFPSFDAPGGVLEFFGVNHSKNLDRPSWVSPTDWQEREHQPWWVMEEAIKQGLKTRDDLCAKFSSGCVVRLRFEIVKPGDGNTPTLDKILKSFDFKSKN